VYADWLNGHTHTHKKAMYTEIIAYKFTLQTNYTNMENSNRFTSQTLL